MTITGWHSFERKLVPSWPLSPAPQVKSLPNLSSRAEWFWPQAIDFTSTGQLS